ncbi:MAG: hypothetical protein PHQ28_00880 [Mycobacterium sp.]|nr:hypothetical protein [Mycobacterium sp.]
MSSIVKSTVVIRLLSLRGFARRSGLSYGTVLRYRHEGRLPAPDGELTDDPDGNMPEGDVHSHPGWLPATVDNWQRPGQGARTDLKRAHDST